jgi:hypothetical protein
MEVERNAEMWLCQLACSSTRFTPHLMDFLHSQLARVQQQLAFVSVDPIDWKFYVQVFSWAVTLFESYLLCVWQRVHIVAILTRPRLRQYPLYSKTSPPAALASHISASDFEKSQKYGKDKAKFALFSGLYRQCLDSTMLHFGFYAWSWDVAGRVMARFGYGVEYQVRRSKMVLRAMILTISPDYTVHWFCVPAVLPFGSSNSAPVSVQHFCSFQRLPCFFAYKSLTFPTGPRRKIWIQQDFAWPIRRGSA